MSIDSAGVRGVRALPFSELRSTFPVLKNQANANRAVPLTAEQFHYAFTNTETEEESRWAYDHERHTQLGRQGNGHKQHW